MKYVLVILICFISFSCKYFNKNKKDIVIASVYNEKLTISDIQGIVPIGSSKVDSISTIKNYINNWIVKNIMLHKSEKNLNARQKDFSKQINDYRNSLIIYTYQNELIRQKLDTTVTDKEIESYYNNNNNDFELKDNIIKVIYVKTSVNNPFNKKIKVLYKSDKEKDIRDLTDVCAKQALNYFLDDSKWLFFNDLIKEIPIKTYDQDSYIKNNRFIEMQDDKYAYFVNIKGFRIKEGISPLNLERENIRNIIINKRKISMIKKLEIDLFKEAEKSNEIKIY